jgi:predicted nucleic acid-binding protein
VRALFDTNVVLDVLLDRQPFSDDAAWLMSRVECSEISGLLCATTVTTIHYLMEKSLGGENARKHIRLLLSLFEIAPVNRVVIENALERGFSDYEDAVLVEAAHHAGAEYILTRSITDFKKSSIPAYTPAGFIQVLASSNQDRGKDAE